MSEQIAHVTNELEAGACGLDGEQLIAELLRENLDLISQLKHSKARTDRLRQQCGRMFACLMTSICAFAILMAWSLV